MVKNILIDSLDLEGGVLCLDFANSLSDRQHLPGTEYLTRFEDLLYWATYKANIIQEESALLLEKRAAEEPSTAAQFFKEAITLRGLLYNIFFEISKGGQLAAADLHAFNEQAKQCMPHLQLQQHGEGFVETWDWEAGDFRQITAPLIKSAYGLLLSDRLERIKGCSSDHCGWLFLDTSKNGKRRWCSMKTCGSNDKAIKYYYRKKEREEEPQP